MSKNRELSDNDMLVMWEGANTGDERVTMKALAERLGLPYHAMRSRIYRARMARDHPQIKNRPDLFDVITWGEPLVLRGSVTVVSDVQIPSTDYDFAMLPALVATRYLPRPRTLILNGDFLNMDYLTSYAKLVDLPNWKAEEAAARNLLEFYFETFDRVYWVRGNHEARWNKALDGQNSLAELVSLVTPPGKSITTSHFDHLFLDTPNGRWLITHGANYSIVPLTVANELAYKFRCHVVMGHEHHFGITWDRFGHQIIVNGGGLYDPPKMAYVSLDATKRPRMKKGFVIIKNGYPHLFGEEPFTSWSDVLPD